MALLKRKENVITKSTPKKARAKATKARSSKVKQIKDDESLSHEYSELDESIEADNNALEDMLSEYNKQVAELVKKDPETKKLKAEVTKLQKRLDKSEERKENIVDYVIDQLRDGVKSLFWDLKEVVGRSSTSYKGVCDQLVDEKVVKKNIMDKVLDEHTKRSMKEILLFEGDEV